MHFEAYIYGNLKRIWRSRHYVEEAEGMFERVIALETFAELTQNTYNTYPVQSKRCQFQCPAILYKIGEVSIFASDIRENAGQ